MGRVSPGGAALLGSAVPEGTRLQPFYRRPRSPEGVHREPPAGIKPGGATAPKDRAASVVQESKGRVVLILPM